MRKQLFAAVAAVALLGAAAAYAGSFQNPDGSSFVESFGGPVTVVVSSSGSTITMTNDQRDLYVNNGSTYATLTIKLPNVGKGQMVNLACKGTITALTVQDSGGNAITGSPTSCAANVARIMRYVDDAVKWVLWK